jgi:hypothetical protein
MLALCSDLDETVDRETYWSTMCFLNSTRSTATGPGLGLEVGNSIYFDMPGGQFSYWNTDDAGRAMVHRLIRSGHVDCLHSFGDLTTTRAQAGRALDELSRHDCRLEVWIDHAVASTNFGADIMRGRGDVPGSPVYHADLTCGFGIRYVWRGRVTSVTAQDVPRNLGGILDGRHPMNSAKTLAKEWLKGILAKRYPKYAMHRPNQVMRLVTLRDGRPVVEFMRANPHWAGVDRGETASGLSDVLTEAMLDRLVDRGGVSVLYTHLGKRLSPDGRLPTATQAALRRLAERSRAGHILVTTTRRLLGYCRVVRDVTFSLRTEDDGVTIDLALSGPPRPTAPPLDELQGLTFYVADPKRTRIALNGCDVSAIERNRADHTGRPSVSIPWSRLEFPDQ